MGAQFNSWRYPIYLLLPVPLALVGALFVVFLKGSGLDVFGLLGMLMLIGLSAKNAILYLDFVVERIGKMPFVDALIEAGRLRFRPIVMTTLTVLVTSFPLIFGHGQGSEFGQGLGIVTFGGILFSAVLTFFVVPAAFYTFEKNRQNVSFNAAKAEIDARSPKSRKASSPDWSTAQDQPDGARAATNKKAKAPRSEDEEEYEILARGQETLFRTIDIIRKRCVRNKYQLSILAGLRGRAHTAPDEAAPSAPPTFRSSRYSTRPWPQATILSWSRAASILRGSSAPWTSRRQDLRSRRAGPTR